MKELIFNTEIRFLEAAKESFNFPIVNAVRQSFWLKGDKVSTFCEIQFNNDQININNTCIVTIKIVERDFLENKLIVGTAFELGIFPLAIATGKIISL